MINTLKKILGIGPKADYTALIANGATIIDVRSQQEYKGGHIKGSINIPLDKLATEGKKIKDKAKPIITCCASGMRSASAKSILKSQGFLEVHNGGGWTSLVKHTRK